MWSELTYLYMQDKLIYKELSYKIIGLLFQIHNEFGRMLNEREYADRFEELLKENFIQYEREKYVSQGSRMDSKRRNRVDFIIENKMVVEFKTVSFLSKDDYFQCQRYLSSSGLRLALLINFRSKYLAPRRILNYELYNKEK